MSGLLFFEDGTKFTGAGAMSSEYQYYHCREKKLRISKDKIETQITIDFNAALMKFLCNLICSEIFKHSFLLTTK